MLEKASQLMAACSSKDTGLRVGVPV